MVKIFTIIVFLLSFSAYSQAEKEDVQLHNELKAFVPVGWKTIAVTEGDLNKDGIRDAALVIEQTDKANYIANKEGLGPGVLNVNPRKLIVLFRDRLNKSYVVAAEKEGFIPAQNSYDSPCLEDPFMDEGDINIKNGLLILELYTFMSCGSWSTSLETFKFRFNGTGFTLIGYDRNETHRGNDEIMRLSVNFLTKKQSITTANNLAEEGDVVSKPVTKWSAIKLEKLLTLEDLQRDTVMDF